MMLFRPLIAKSALPIYTPFRHFARNFKPDPVRERKLAVSNAKLDIQLEELREKVTKQ